MTSDAVGERTAHPLVTWVAIPLYALLALSTTFVALWLLIGLGATLLSARGLEGYCSHGGLGETVLVVMLFGSPIVLLQVILSFLIGRSMTRSIKVALTLALPLALVFAISPCFLMGERQPPALSPPPKPRLGFGQADPSHMMPNHVMLLTPPLRGGSLADARRS